MLEIFVRTSKVTRSGRVFSPQTSPKAVTTPVRITTIESTIETRGKEQMTEPAHTEASKEGTVEDTSKQEMKEVIKLFEK